jgi:hypothetical protein
MRKKLLVSITALSLAFYGISSCAEENKEPVDEATAKSGAVTKKVAEQPSDAENSIMNQPLDFSTPEGIETSMQNVREQAGDKAYRKLDNAMKYLLYYDLGVKNNKDALYKKLDGETPEQIIAKGKH